MQFDLYQEECARTADLQTGLLNEAKMRLGNGKTLSLLEQGGVLHALQVLIENAIGKSKHCLKALDASVPVSAYDCFVSLHQQGKITQDDLAQWNAAIGLRNRIVHDYMNVDMQFVYGLILADKHVFVADFLRQPI